MGNNDATVRCHGNISDRKFILITASCRCQLPLAGIQTRAANRTLGRTPCQPQINQAVSQPEDKQQLITPPASSHRSGLSGHQPKEKRKAR